MIACNFVWLKGEKYIKYGKFLVTLVFFGDEIFPKPYEFLLVNTFIAILVFIDVENMKKGSLWNFRKNLITKPNAKPNELILCK